MRPYIDISHELHGKVLDYRDENELGTTEAYEQLIEEALSDDT